MVGKRWRLVRSAGVYLGVLAFTAFALFPFLWMLASSVKPPSEIYTSPPRWIIDNPTFDHYANVLFNKGIPQVFWNTFEVSALTTLIATLLAVIAGYGFARLPFRGKGFWSLVILFSQMLPQMVLLIPLYNLLSHARMINTVPGLILAYLVTTLPLVIWMLRGYFAGIPRELEESAMIDGCTRLGAIFRIIVPISAPAIIATAIYSFNHVWQEFVFALNFTTTTRTKTLSVLIMDMMGENTTNWGDITAASVVSTLPVVLLFLSVHKYFIRGLTEGGVKG